MKAPAMQQLLAATPSPVAFRSPWEVQPRFLSEIEQTLQRSNG
jgi:hypothetical protein